MSLSFVNVKKAIEVIHMSGHTPCIIGLQGIGKSDLVKEYAKEKGYVYQEITCSLLQEGDLAMPYLSPCKDGDVEYAVNRIIKDLVKKSQGSKGILFLDEFNRGSSNTQSELMNLVLQRRILDYSLPENIFIVLAMNPSSEMKGYEDSDYSVSFSDAAILGRVVKLDMKPSLQEWISYGKRVENGHQRIHQAVISYLSAIEKEFVTKEVSGEINNNPRAWSRVSDILYSYESMGIRNVTLLRELLFGTIRRDSVAQFLATYESKVQTFNYMNLARDVLFAKSIDDWDIPKLEGMTDAELSNLFKSMCELYNNSNVTEDMKNMMSTFISSASGELVYTWVTSLRQNNHDLYVDLLEIDNFADCVNSIMKKAVSGKAAGGFSGK